MTRVEENVLILKEANKIINSLLSRREELDTGIQPGEFLLSGTELAKSLLLADISKSLAVIADKLTHE